MDWFNSPSCAHPWGQPTRTWPNRRNTLNRIIKHHRLETRNVWRVLHKYNVGTRGQFIWYIMYNFYRKRLKTYMSSSLWELSKFQRRIKVIFFIIWVIYYAWNIEDTFEISNKKSKPYGEWCDFCTTLKFQERLDLRSYARFGDASAPGPWFNIKMSSYQYRKSHCGDKTVVRSSYLHNGISYTGKMSSLYWIGALIALRAQMGFASDRYLIDIDLRTFTSWVPSVSFASDNQKKIYHFYRSQIF